MRLGRTCRQLLKESEPPKLEPRSDGASLNMTLQFWSTQKAGQWTEVIAFNEYKLMICQKSAWFLLNCSFYNETLDPHLGNSYLKEVTNRGNFEQTGNPQIDMSHVFLKAECDQIRKTWSKICRPAITKVLNLPCDPQLREPILTEALELKTRFGIPASDSLKGGTIIVPYIETSSSK